MEQVVVVNFFFLDLLHACKLVCHINECKEDKLLVTGAHNYGLLLVSNSSSKRDYIEIECKFKSNLCCLLPETIQRCSSFYLENNGRTISIV